MGLRGRQEGEKKGGGERKLSARIFSRSCAVHSQSAQLPRAHVSLIKSPCPATAFSPLPPPGYPPRPALCPPPLPFNVPQTLLIPAAASFHSRLISSFMTRRSSYPDSGARGQEGRRERERVLHQKVMQGIPLIAEIRPDGQKEMGNRLRGPRDFYNASAYVTEESLKNGGGARRAL
jgi:hypothetical protein